MLGREEDPTATVSREIDFGTALSLAQYRDNRWGLKVTIDHQVLAAFISEMMLLEDAYIDSISLRGERVNVSLRHDREAKLSFGQIQEQHLTIRLNSIDIGFAMSFLLKYYPDGMAEVDHIDVALMRTDRVDTEAGTLILKATDAQPGMSGDEAKRILGID